MLVVNTTKLCKIYQLGSIQLPALRDVDLEIEQGQYVAVMGPSGLPRHTYQRPLLARRKRCLRTR
jgi:putative ABC transport system ATP-binding protein